MSNDTFIREVNEEIRQQRARDVWERFGPFAIALAVLVVLGTAAWVAYDWWSVSRANRSGDQFSQALQLAEEGKTAEAVTALQALESEGVGAYPLLARMRSATALAQSGDFAGAVREFDEVAADTGIPQSVRDMANLRAALVLVDHGTAAEVAQRVEGLAQDTNPLRHSAREAMGLSAWRENRAADALGYFDRIIEDQAAPVNTRQRAQMMADLIRGSGAAG